NQRVQSVSSFTSHLVTECRADGVHLRLSVSRLPPIADGHFSPSRLRSVRLAPHDRTSGKHSPDRRHTSPLPADGIPLPPAAPFAGTATSARSTRFPAWLVRSQKLKV